MTVGLLTIELSIEHAFSLKEKRVVLNRVRDLVRKKFNVSVAEVDANDAWNYAVVGIAVVANQQRHANQVLSQVVNYVETIRDCVIEDVQTEFL